MRKVLVVLCLFISFLSYCQNEENFWFFGNHAGLDFNSGSPVALLSGQISTDEGCSTISDSMGQLLFYTDGITVWNKNHQTMDNGVNLNGHTSTAQSATIVQNPYSNNLYYIFTIDAGFGSKGFCYSEVDISLNGGLGLVINKNIFINSQICEKITIIQHSNNIDFWVIVHSINNVFYSYLVNKTGISSSPIVSYAGVSVPFYLYEAAGIIKSSPDCSKIAVTSTGRQKVELFEFNNNTGKISNGKIIKSGTSSSDNYYGIEFSPNGKLLYVSNESSSVIKQFDLTATNISSTEVNLYGEPYEYLGTLQIGVDQRIYVANNDRPYIGVIKNPNIAGVNCLYQSNAINLNGKTSNLGLPSSFTMNNISIDYKIENICSNSITSFSILTSLNYSNVLWDFGDGNNSTEISPTHSYNKSGNYNVSLIINVNSKTYTKHLNLSINTNPISIQTPQLTTPQTFCIQKNTTISNITVTGQNIQWYDAQTGGNLISNTTALVNVTTYYASQTINGCESLRVPVTINIQNTPAPTGSATQTLCATQNPTVNDIALNESNLIWYISNTNTTPISNTTLLTNNTTYYAAQVVNGCESVNRFAVTVTLITTLNATNYSETICDDSNDGTETINLTGYTSNLISNTANCTFDYYSSSTGATNQTASDLINATTNYNLTIGLHTIYVRITSNNGCHQIVELKFTLVSKPVVPIDDIMPICEKNTITINAGSGFDSYLWSNGSKAHSIVVAQPGNYSITVTQNHGTVVCSTTKNFSVVLSNVATITSIETQDWTDNENIITVNTAGMGDYEYSIDGIHYQDSNTFTGLLSGQYTVYVRDKNGCGIANDEVFLLTYPKFFTPNGDGYNDTWKIKFSQYEAGLNVKIIDRYGKLIKALQNSASWDGTYNGNLSISDDYWFIVTRANGKEYKGHFSLKR